MQPQVFDELRCAASKIHISFDRWTVKGGKRGFFSIVAHFATAKGDLRDVAIDLPQLSGAYTSDRIADCVAETLTTRLITTLLSRPLERSLALSLSIAGYVVALIQST